MKTFKTLWEAIKDKAPAARIADKPVEPAEVVPTTDSTVPQGESPLAKKMDEYERFYVDEEEVELTEAQKTKLVKLIKKKKQLKSGKTTILINPTKEEI